MISTSLTLLDIHGLLPRLAGSKLTTMAGSAYYIAPEVLNNCYGMEADMWSVGVILYILLSGLPPFWAEKEEGIFEAIKTGKIDVFSGIWEGISQDAKDIVLRMLTRDPSKRITPEKALSTSSQPLGYTFTTMLYCALFYGGCVLYAPGRPPVFPPAAPHCCALWMVPKTENRVSEYRL